MNILPGVLLYIQIAKISGKTVSLPEFVMGASETSALTRIVRARSDEPDTWAEVHLDNTAQPEKRRLDSNRLTLPTKTRSFRLLQCQNVDSLVNSVHQIPLEWREDQMD